MSKDIQPKGLPAWKYREIASAKRAAGEQEGARQAAITQVYRQHEAEKDVTAAREDWSYKNARYCAGHDWAKEREERTGEIERSR